MATAFARTVASGDRTKSLVALRDMLAASLEATPAYARAPLVKQLREVMDEIDRVPAAEEVDPVDELIIRRAARQATAEASAGAAKGDKRGQRGRRSS